jgi:hypothetical protein
LSRCVGLKDGVWGRSLRSGVAGLSLVAGGMFSLPLFGRTNLMSEIAAGSTCNKEK